MNAHTQIIGTGHFVPPKVVTNFDLEKQMNTSDEWIRTRSGIAKRHYASAGVGTSDLAVEASRLAIEDAGIEPGDIDLVIAATLSPDHYFPGIGVLIQAKLGLGTTGALDIRNQCSGFIYGLSVADMYISAGGCRTVLLVAAEIQSSNLDYSDKGRDVAVLFGDGAGALVLQANLEKNGKGILSTHLFADGRFVDKLWMEKPSPKDKPVFSQENLEAGGFAPCMNGKHVFINAVEKMPESVNHALQQNGLTIDDVDHLIPHQANDRISLMVAQKLKIPVEKVIRNISEYGNTTSASIPIALDESLRNGRIREGDLAVFTAFGSGYTWASAVVQF